MTNMGTLRSEELQDAQSKASEEKVAILRWRQYTLSDAERFPDVSDMPALRHPAVRRSAFSRNIAANIVSKELCG